VKNAIPNIVAHGVRSSITTATPPVTIATCVGDLAYKVCVATAAAEEWCNHGAATSADNCIADADLLLPGDAKGAYRVAGDNATPTKWCFSTNTAVKCLDTEVCNPWGVSGGADATKTCVTATESLAHKESADAAATPPKLICIGNRGSSKAVPAAADGDADLIVCNWGDGKSNDPAHELAAGTAQDESTQLVALCYGAADIATCAADAYCNASGTDKTACTDACTNANICIDGTAIIAASGQFKAEKTIICLAEDGSAAAVCDDESTPPLPYCDIAEGECVEIQPASGDDGTGDPAHDDDGHGSGASATGFVAASVAAMLAA